MSLICLLIVLLVPHILPTHASRVISTPVIARKHPLSESLDREEEGKWHKRDNIPSEGVWLFVRRRLTVPIPFETAVINTLYANLKQINSDPEWYSNPQNKTNIPFPFIYSRLPTDRFLLLDSPGPVFEYMGRERFSELWELVKSMKIVTGFSQLLSCLWKHTVYLPDCRKLLKDPFPYLQSALLCASADSVLERERIRFPISIDDILLFCQCLGGTQLYFVLDQMNALYQEGINQDQAANTEKQALSNFLQKLFIGHCSITSSSANYNTAIHMRRKQTGELKMSTMGGLTKVECQLCLSLYLCSLVSVTERWRHHEGRAPTFKAEADRNMVADLTGCIPLLRPLLKSNGQDFSVVEKSIWNSEEFTAVRERTSKCLLSRSREKTIISQSGI
jgi:hypothetical protein